MNPQLKKNKLNQIEINRQVLIITRTITNQARLPQPLPPPLENLMKIKEMHLILNHNPAISLEVITDI